MKAGYYPDDHSPGSPHYRFQTINAIKLALVLNPAISLTPLFCRYFHPKCDIFNCKASKIRIIVMQPCCGFWEEETMYVVPRLKMLRWIFLFILFFLSLHVAVTRLYMVKFVYTERLALHLLDILYTSL